MSQSPESLANSPVLPCIYKQPFAEPDAAEGINREIPQLAALESRSDDIFETSHFEGMVNNEALENDEQAGRFARMGSFVTNKLVELKTGVSDIKTSAQESISNVGNTISEGVKKHPKLSKLATGMAVLALSAGVAEQATGENTPINKAEATPALTGEALKQFCLQEGLKVPTVSEAILWFPGSSPENPNPPGRFQTANITPKAIDAMPSECTGQYDRKQYMKVDIQNPTKRKKYYTITRPKWQYINGNADSNNGGGDAVTRQVQASNGLPKAYYYRRTPGPRVTHVRGRLKNTVTEKATGKVIGTKYGTKFSVTPKGGAR